MQWHRDASNHQKADVRLSWTTICLFHQLTETERTSPSSCLAHCTLVFSAQAVYKHQRSLTGQSCIHWVRRFHSSSTVFLTSLQRDELVPGGLHCQPIQLIHLWDRRPLLGLAAERYSRHGTEQHCPLSQKQQGEIHPQYCSVSITRWSSTTRLCLTIFW